MYCAKPTPLAVTASAKPNARDPTIVIARCPVTAFEFDEPMYQFSVRLHKKDISPDIPPGGSRHERFVPEAELCLSVPLCEPASAGASSTP